MDAYCGNCGARVEEADARYCASCGESLPPPEPTSIACPSCGVENPFDAEFCMDCGKPLEEERKRHLAGFILPTAGAAGGAALGAGLATGAGETAAAAGPAMMGAGAIAEAVTGAGGMAGAMSGAGASAGATMAGAGSMASAGTGAMAGAGALGEAMAGAGSLAGETAMSGAGAMGQAMAGAGAMGEAPAMAGAGALGTPPVIEPPPVAPPPATPPPPPAPTAPPVAEPAFQPPSIPEGTIPETTLARPPTGPQIQELPPQGGTTTSPTGPQIQELEPPPETPPEPPSGPQIEELERPPETPPEPPSGPQIEELEPPPETPPEPPSAPAAQPATQPAEILGVRRGGGSRWIGRVIRIGGIATGGLGALVILIGALILTGDPSPCVSRTSVPSSGAAAALQQKWDAFKVAAAPATVQFTEQEVTSRGVSYVDERDVPISNLQVYFCPDGKAEAKGTASLLGRDVHILVRGSLDVANNEIVVDSVQAGNLPSFISTPLVNQILDRNNVRSLSLGVALTSSTSTDGAHTLTR